MAEYGEESLEESVSTISVDSVTYNNLSVQQSTGNSLPSNSLPSNVVQRKYNEINLSQSQVAERMKEVEIRENEIERVLMQNNKLMKLLLQHTKDNKLSVTNIKTTNSELKKEIAELKSELAQKATEIRAFNNSDKNANAQRMKIDQAAAAVKDLRDQLYEKERLIEMMKCKMEQDYTALVTENKILKVQLEDSETKKLDHERRCDSLSCSLEENQMMIDALNEQLMKEKAMTDDYKGQLAVLSCQEAVNWQILQNSTMGMEQMSPGSIQRHLAVVAALVGPSDPSHFTRPGMEGRGIEQSLGAALAASHHGEHPAPPSSSPYIDYTEHRHY